MNILLSFAVMIFFLGIPLLFAIRMYRSTVNEKQHFSLRSAEGLEEIDVYMPSFMKNGALTDLKNAESPEEKAKFSMILMFFDNDITLMDRMGR